MKYFWELGIEQQEQVLDKIQPLPLFKHFREDARLLLLTSKNYLVYDNLVVHSITSE